MTGIAEFRKRAMRDPQSLSEAEWQQIHKVAFTVPKKDFSDEVDTAKVNSSGPSKKRKGWW